MMTEWVWTGSLAAFARVCKLRLDPHSQRETQEIAKMISDNIPKEFNASWNALMEN
jgi:thymidylate synthase (FAD)